MTEHAAARGRQARRRLRPRAPRRRARGRAGPGVRRSARPRRGRARPSGRRLLDASPDARLARVRISSVRPRVRRLVPPRARCPPTPRADRPSQHGERRKGGVRRPGPGDRRRRARGRRVERRRAPADAGLRGDDARGVRPRALADPGDRASSGRVGGRTAFGRTVAGRRSTCARSSAPRSRPAATRSCATFRSRGTAPRKLVLLLDVSGSMEAYARALLLYLHAARGSGRGVETFAFGTRLTRLTPELGDARSGRRARGGRDARAGLVGRHAHRRVAQGVQRRVGQACADARRRRRDPLATAASAATPRSCATRWRGSRGRRSRSSG